VVVAHGLLVSVLQWAREHPPQSLTKSSVAPCLRPLVLPEAELSSLSQRLLHDLEQAPRRACGWHADLGVFPKELRTAFATVGVAEISLEREDKAAAHA
jgi:2,3-bisphosphoglycerate-dependent phosphoglycerate mutase